MGELTWTANESALKRQLSPFTITGRAPVGDWTNSIGKSHTVFSLGKKNACAVSPTPELRLEIAGLEMLRIAL